MLNWFSKKRNRTCPRCSVDLKLLRRNELVTIDGQVYCDTCAQNMKQEKSAPQFACFACGERFPDTEARNDCGKKNDMCFAYQISPFCLEAGGEHIRVFSELGFGHQGFYTIGIKFAY